MLLLFLFSFTYLVLVCFCSFLLFKFLLLLVLNYFTQSAQRMSRYFLLWRSNTRWRVSNTPNSKRFLTLETGGRSVEWIAAVHGASTQYFQLGEVEKTRNKLRSLADLLQEIGIIGTVLLMCARKTFFEVSQRSIITAQALSPLLFRSIAD